MSEGESPQFDPKQDEPVEPAAEVESSLEQLKNPKYWEQEFQRSWEKKAGQEKNWSGLKYLRNFVLSSNDPDQ